MLAVRACCAPLRAVSPFGYAAVTHTWIRDMRTTSKTRAFSRVRVSVDTFWTPFLTRSFLAITAPTANTVCANHTVLYRITCILRGCVFACVFSSASSSVLPHANVHWLRGLRKQHRAHWFRSVTSRSLHAFFSPLFLRFAPLLDRHHRLAAPSSRPTAFSPAPPSTATPLCTRNTFRNRYGARCILCLARFACERKHPRQVCCHNRYAATSRGFRVFGLLRSWTLAPPIAPLTIYYSNRSPVTHGFHFAALSRSRSRCCSSLSPF